MGEFRSIGQKQNISWNNVEQYLKAQNADQKAIATIRSIFNTFDTSNDGAIDQKELEQLSKFIEQYDTLMKDGKLSIAELNALQDGHEMKSAGENLTNTFLDAVQKAEVSEIQDLSSSEKTDYKKDKDGNLITYPIEGESFRATASRLGFKFGTPEYQEFLAANKHAGQRNWFRVGEEVKIPPSLQDKVNEEMMLNKTEGMEQIQVYERKYGGTRPEAPAKGGGGATTPSSPTSPSGNTPVQPNQLPKNIQDLIKQNPNNNIQKTDNGYLVRINNPNGFEEHSYDTRGKLLSKKVGTRNGKLTETTYTNGTEQTKVIAQDAPQAIQEQMEKMKKSSGGDAYLEYNPKTRRYICVQTNTENNDVKEIRSELGLVTKEKEAELSFWQKCKKKMHLDTGAEKITYKEIDTVARTTTYKDGRIIESTYDPQTGKHIKNTVIKEADKPEVTNTQPEKFYTKADISFTMPQGAPTSAKNFCGSLTDNKERLMRQLGIDNDTYNMLAQTAVGIAGKETKFGQWVLRDDDGDWHMSIDSLNLSVIGKDTLGNNGISALKRYNGDTSALSVGLTQLKFDVFNDPEKEPEIANNFKVFGITNKEQLDDPKVSAIATMIVLATLNKRLDAEPYKSGIDMAQGINVEYPGWEMGSDGIGRKTKNGVTHPWKNEITRQDALCALWSGGSTAKSLANGKFTPGGWAYTNEVREYTNKYKLQENSQSRKEAQAKYEEIKPFTNGGNNGDIGGIIFLPGMYTDGIKHRNTPTEIQNLNNTLQRKGINPNLRTQLVSALQNGELGFDFGLRQEEIEALNEHDIKLLLQHLDKLKKNIGNINTSDGINTQEAATLRNNYATTVANAENEFRTEYLNRHSRVYNLSDSNAQALRETALYTNNDNFVTTDGRRRGFMHEKAQPVNTKTSKGSISEQEELLANSGYDVVMKNQDNTRSGQCLTGVKEAMTNAGIDVSDMVDFGTVPKFAKNWFEAHNEMFTPVKYVDNGDGTAREINSSDLRNLPAGYIVIWAPEEGTKYGDQAGHIVITNGNGQGYADATDNLGWGMYTSDQKASGKGEHGQFYVYKLSDNWEVKNGQLVLKK